MTRYDFSNVWGVDKALDGEYVKFSDMLQFLGFLAGYLPELHQVEVPRLYDALSQFPDEAV
jgi:hypothetical protein